MELPDLPDLTDVEARATAADRLDLHFEHRDALDVERGTWRLAEHLARYAELQVMVGDHAVRGSILALGPDWVHLTTALVRLAACTSVHPSGVAEVPTTVLDFRQAIRQAAGRVPREVILADGQARLLAIDWVARDFVHVHEAGRPALMPLGQFAAVFGRIEVG
jgi:hypothetical protein